MTTQKGAPSLAWRPTPFDHVLGDARLRDLKPELEQFAVDAWRAPKRIFDIRRINETRTHLALDKDAPLSRTVKRAGRILCRPVLGGLHHKYVRI